MHNSKTQEQIQFEELFKIKKTTNNDCEFMTVFRTDAKGPFNVDSEEVESFYFEDINTVLKETEPEKFTETTVLLLIKYKEKFL